MWPHKLSSCSYARNYHHVNLLYDFSIVLKDSFFFNVCHINWLDIFSRWIKTMCKSSLLPYLFMSWSGKMWFLHVKKRSVMCLVWLTYHSNMYINWDGWCWQLEFNVAYRHGPNWLDQCISSGIYHLYKGLNYLGIKSHLVRSPLHKHAKPRRQVIDLNLRPTHGGGKEKYKTKQYRGTTSPNQIDYCPTPCCTNWSSR